MNVFVYNLPVDPSYRTGWYKYPDTEPVAVRYGLPDIPLKREMSIELPFFGGEIGGTSGYRFVVIQTKGDIRGFFVKDFHVFGNGRTVKLDLDMDIWFSTSILRSVYWEGKFCSLPNRDIAKGLYYVGSNFENRWGEFGVLDSGTMNITRRSAIIFSCTAKASSSNTAFYYTVISPTFDNYTEFQQWYNVILTADTLAYKLGTDTGYGAQGEARYDPPIDSKDFNKLTIDSIQSMAIMSYPDGLEINRDITLYDWDISGNVQTPRFKYHDLPATCGVGRQISKETPRGWTILGNLLGDVNSFSTSQSLSIVPSPRSWRKNWTVGFSDTDPVYQLVIGNNSTFVTLPGGAYADLVFDITLTGGISPVKEVITINGEPLDLTPTLNIPFFVTTSRDQDEQNSRRWGTSLLSNAINGVGQIMTRDYPAAASTAISTIGMGHPRRSFSTVTGDGADAVVWRVLGQQIFIGTCCVGGLNRTLNVTTKFLQNVYGDRYAGDVSMTFYYLSPPSNYETIGVFQIDNPIPLPTGFTAFASSSEIIGEVTDIVHRGIYLYNPDED